MKGVVNAVLLLATLTAAAQAQQSYISSGHNGQQGGAVVVDVPPEVFNRGGDSAAPCQRCCIYENRSYSEGAVLKTEGVLLQCVRDEQSLGTSNLIWRIVK
ncbi:DUF1496 domain-containing protein [Erwinia sp. E602]|uniref:DUF1496 domain-containing protein n=1 Tax=unclassified Erwinia TaxID=2622719 RepID=UPI0006F4A70C|nr:MULTISPECIES: DUF1496 domain-containing protein [unclassified Erwinia]KQN53141.1 hypothetical protein ASF13_16195 [Erwinia sp. Leaf53]PLV61723.1 hypothetical protein NV64_08295 [Erwinia sp. B116]QUG75923.1 DUF1496 domain-containing protein [Erwinia sp. E602]